MKRKQFSEEQIIGILKETEAGAAVTELCGKHGMSRARPATRGRQVGLAGGIRREASAGARGGERTAEAAARGHDAGHRPGAPGADPCGGLSRGRRFAAQIADCVIAPASEIAAMKAYRDDVRERAAACGRSADEFKVLFVTTPFLDDTDAAARDRFDRYALSDGFRVKYLASMSAVTEIDLSTFDLDRPLPPLKTNGEQGSLDAFAQMGERQAAAPARGRARQARAGRPDRDAGPGGRLSGRGDAEVGGDGILITPPFQKYNRRYVAEVCEGPVPALQRRGLARLAYSATTLRETLREF